MTGLFKAAKLVYVIITSASSKLSGCWYFLTLYYIGAADTVGLVLYHAVIHVQYVFISAAS